MASNSASNVAVAGGYASSAPAPVAPPMPSSEATTARVEVDASATADASVESSEAQAEKRVMKAMERVLDEWFVTGITRAGAMKFIQDKICKGDVEECRRVRQWLLLRMNGRTWDHGIDMMCRTAENVPGLGSFHVWPRERMPWLAQVEEQHGDILAEILAARSRERSSQPSGFQPYRDPHHKGAEDRAAKDGIGVEGVDRGMWNVLYLFLNHKRFEDNCARFPKTIAAIEKVFPRQYSHAFFLSFDTWNTYCKTPWTFE
eukprot:TRINITY_DN22193_c0_g1_i2.p1 TRINITY_DN22193_c0_g1~~TRINITY_DN22193_c0_g1_i2.p1  ORF type:complete len:260 (-),score=46.31 TRINITY_DN22193_c0_g1_i2:537-1316(-)